ncbi:hypothetical protein LCGC14_0622440 [marine sediment metagenome]|uniref:Uncharacterized protein n=1 Tax=marine sediment metagenome TaxID=412755 RepID=A0A0F9UCU5_9ZZZZ
MKDTKKILKLRSETIEEAAVVRGPTCVGCEARKKAKILGKYNKLIY